MSRFFHALYDFSLTDFVIVDVARIAYAVSIWLVTVGSGALLGFSIWQALTLPTLRDAVMWALIALAVPFGYLLAVLMLRLETELAIVLFRIESHLKTVASGQLRP